MIKMQLVRDGDFLIPNKYHIESLYMLEHILPCGYVEFNDGGFSESQFITLMNLHGWDYIQLDDHTSQ